MAGTKPTSMNVLKLVEVPSPLTAPDKLNGDVVHLQNGNSQFQNIVTLNVGGTVHTTTLSTLLKYPDSMLAAMFSGRHHVATDEKGRYFIDRDGQYFHHIINYLRDDKLPPLNRALEVYEEAQYYNISPLITALNSTCPVARHKIRRLFLAQVPNYDVNIEMLIEKAQEIAKEQPDRSTKFKVCVFKEDNPASIYESSLIPPVPGERSLPLSCQKSHRCNVALTFGPWTAIPDVYDLLHCIKEDVAKRGYDLQCYCIGVCDQHLAGPFYCKRPIYEFKFTWW